MHAEIQETTMTNSQCDSDYPDSAGVDSQGSQNTPQVISTYVTSMFKATNSMNKDKLAGVSCKLPCLL